ncbi:MAG: hypothetical protein KatS3mg110_3849 [Pirellulaceae bacterium]|nr:MAG: hypothetical protein KatS3mg110_3849 [Pirellulaceae bacterium]
MHVADRLCTYHLLAGQKESARRRRKLPDNSNRRFHYSISRLVVRRSAALFAPRLFQAYYFAGTTHT